LDLWLHVGTGKTGTSAIQVVLARHRQALEAAGLFYPSSGEDEGLALRGGITSGNAKRLGWLAAPVLRPPGFDPAPVERWLDGVLEAAAGRPVLLSSETLQVPDREAFAPVVARLAARGWRVRILYLARHALEHAVALYGQWLKVGHRTNIASLEEFLLRHRAPFRRQLREWAALVGRENVTCRVYDVERKGEGLVRNLLRCIGPGFADAIPPEATPPSLNRTPTALELLIYERLVRGQEEPRLPALRVTQAVLGTPPAVPAEIRIPRRVFEDFAERNAPIVEAVNAQHFGGRPVLAVTAGRIRIGEPPAHGAVQEAALAETAAAMLAATARLWDAEARSLREHTVALEARIAALEAQLAAAR
jgi:hypothetical protein